MPELTPAEARSCKNCGRALTDDFCGACGQRDKDTLRPFIIFVQELVFTILELDGRAYKTLFFLYTKPGFLSSEYAKGRRARYTPPLRLFLVISIGFFLLVSLSTSIQSIRDSATGSALTNESELNVSESEGDGEIVSAEGLDEDDIESAITFLSEIEFSFLSEQSNQSLNGFLVSQFEAKYQEVTDDPRDFFMGSLEYVTFFMLLMMPLLALILQILYITKKRYYIEHFIFTLHNQAFLVFSIFLLWVLGGIGDSDIPYLGEACEWLALICSVWIVIYLFLSLKRFYGQGFIFTSIKSVIIFMTYTFCTSVGVFFFFLLLFIFS